MVDASAPHRVGRYEIVLPIATGGMATVYLARSIGVGGFDRYVALKLTAPHLRRDPAFAQHLVDEAKLVAHLRHPNVVQPFDVGECEQGVYLVMEYVAGDSLSGLRRSAREAGIEFPKAIGLRILVDALKGLHAAHEHTNEDGEPYRLVHRDFSPQNILVGTDGIARLTDFGIAKAASRVSDTSIGSIKGKLTYLAPEQARTESLDRRCDVWAAGVIAWEILSGGRLYAKDDLTPVKPDRPTPPRLQTVATDVPEELDEIVARALRLDREERTPTAQALGRALAAAATAANMLADSEEVAAFVLKLAGDELAARKQRLQEIRRQQGEFRSSVPDVRTMMATAEPVSKRRLADIGDDGSELRISVALPGEADRADTGILGDGETVPEPENPVFRSPVAVGDPRWDRRKVMIAAAGAFAVLGFVLIVTAATRKPAASAKPEAGTSAATVLVAEPELSSLLQVHANAPIASVAIGERLVDSVVPAPNVSIELEDEERAGALRITVTATDGRSIVMVRDTSARDVAVSFPMR